MSELKTNKISTNDGNNVAIDNSLGLKSYGTTARNALTSVAGDMIYNSDDAKVQVYNGTSWDDLGGQATFTADFLVIAGGAAGRADGAGGGGAGGMRSSISATGGSGSTESSLTLATGVAYPVTIGAGAPSNQYVNGSDTETIGIFARGGGAPGNRGPNGQNGGSGGGGGGIGTSKGYGISTQGFEGGNGYSSFGGGGGGGAGAAGTTANSNSGFNGGAGAINTIISTSQATSASVGEVISTDVYYAGGGGGGGNTGSSSGGNGGGGNGSGSGNGGSGTANTGGGGGGAAWQYNGGAGGSGVAIIKYPNTFTSSNTGLTISSTTVTGYKIDIITAGTGTITFS